MIRLRSFVLATSLSATFASAALAGCSDESSDSFSKLNEQMDASADGPVFLEAGASIVTAQTESVALVSFSGAGAIANSFCSTTSETYTVDLDGGTLGYQLCPASGPFIGTPLTGSFTMTSADRAALVAKVSAIVALPASTTPCNTTSDGGLTYSANVSNENGDEPITYEGVDAPCGYSYGDDQTTYVTDVSLGAAYDQAASLVATQLAILEKGGIGVVTPATARISITTEIEQLGTCSLGYQSFDYTLGTHSFTYDVCQTTDGGALADVTGTVQMSAGQTAAVNAAIDAIGSSPLGKFCATDKAAPVVSTFTADGTETDFTGCSGMYKETDVLNVDAAMRTFLALVPGGSD